MEKGGFTCIMYYEDPVNTLDMENGGFTWVNLNILMYDFLTYDSNFDFILFFFFFFVAYGPQQSMLRTYMNQI